jgi:hypothetical protein
VIYLVIVNVAKVINAPVLIHRAKVVQNHRAHTTARNMRIAPIHIHHRVRNLHLHPQHVAPRDHITKTKTKIINVATTHNGTNTQ